MNFWWITRQAVSRCGFNPFVDLKRWGETQLMDWAKEGQHKANAKLQRPAIQAFNINVTSGTREYSAQPRELVYLNGEMIDRVIYTDGDGGIHVLHGTSYEYMDEFEPGWRDIATANDGDIPTRYWYNPNRRSIFLDPIPGATVANGLRIEYIGQGFIPPIIYTTGTVAVTNNSDAVTGTSTAWDSNEALLGGLHFGVIPAATSDDSDPWPKRWYEVQEFGSGTAMTIEEVYTEATQSDASYVLATKSAFSDNYSALQDLPVLWCMAQIYQSERDLQSAAYYKQEFDKQLTEAFDWITVRPDHDTRMNFDSGAFRAQGIGGRW